MTALADHLTAQHGRGSYRYARRRDLLCPRPASAAFFITSTGQRAWQRGAQEIFARLLALAGTATPPRRRSPAQRAT